MFAKYWEPGAVKTRLANDIGTLPASRVYRGLLVAALRRLEYLADRRVLAFSPADRRQEFAALLAETACRWSLEVQGGGDLGARMDRYFATSFLSGARRVVLIGSDSPTFPPEWIERAFELLADFPVVLGPAADGGYYLIGAAEVVPPVFAGVDWSSPAVWQQTISKLTVAAWPYATLPPWYDVDDVHDLRRLTAELAEFPETDVVAQELAETIHAAWRI